MAFWWLLLAWATPAQLSAAILDIGSGEKTGHLVLRFSSGEEVCFRVAHSESTLTGPELVDIVIRETGGQLLVSPGYDVLFGSALGNLTNPANPGLVIQYWNSVDVPFVNGIRWGGPDGAANGDYLGQDNWWRLWVRGPAHLEEPWNDPPSSFELEPQLGWFQPLASGLADLTLQDEAWIGLVYGSSLAPVIPEPGIPHLLSAACILFALRNRRDA